MALELTASAQHRVRELLAQENASWLRLGIRGGGCSGMSYFMDFVAEPKDKDKLFEFGDVRVCVDRKSYLFLLDVKLDYQEDLIRRGFVFDNPSAKRSCSCGDSFSL